MPRVLLAAFCAVPDANRAGVQIPHALRALAEHHAVEVLTLREGGRPYVEQFGNTRMLRVPVPRGSLRERIAAFRRALRRQVEGADYAVVHCCDTWSAAPTVALRERYGFRFVYDPARQPRLDVDDALGRERKLDERACLREADLVLAPTASAARDFEARGARNVCLVPPGVDVDAFDWDVATPREAPEVLYVGPIRAGAGIEVLVRAMKDVCARVPARLRLLGAVDPGFEPVLDRHLDASGLADLVCVGAPVDNALVPGVIARAALCVAPSADTGRDGSESCPTKLLEYLACKRPAVAPRRQTVASMVGDGEHALLFAPNDAIDLAARIVQLLGDPALAATIAEAGYRLVRDRRPASATRRALRAAYARLELGVSAFERRTSEVLDDGGSLVHEVSESELEVVEGSDVDPALAPVADVRDTEVRGDGRGAPGDEPDVLDSAVTSVAAPPAPVDAGDDGDANLPDASKPDAGKPDAGKPGAGEPETGDLETAESGDATTADVTRPAAARSARSLPPGPPGGEAELSRSDDSGTNPGL